MSAERQGTGADQAESGHWWIVIIACSLILGWLLLSPMIRKPEAPPGMLQIHSGGWVFDLCADQGSCWLTVSDEGRSEKSRYIKLPDAYRGNCVDKHGVWGDCQAFYQLQ